MGREEEDKRNSNSTNQTKAETEGNKDQQKEKKTEGPNAPLKKEELVNDTKGQGNTSHTKGGNELKDVPKEKKQEDVPKEKKQEDVPKEKKQEDVTKEKKAELNQTADKGGKDTEDKIQKTEVNKDKSKELESPK